jgi:hypothetical protein
VIVGTSLLFAVAAIVIAVHGWKRRSFSWAAWKILGLGIVWVVAIVFVFRSQADSIDRCLDRGGKWNYDLNRCEGCSDCPDSISARRN